MKDYFHLKRNLVILAILFLIVIVLGFIFRDSFSTLGKAIGIIAPSEDDVIARLMQHPEMQDYSGWTIQVTHLTEEDVRSLAEEQPEIYGGISKDVYKVTLELGSKGVLVLYDYDSDSIVKRLEILNPQLA